MSDEEPLWSDYEDEERDAAWALAEREALEEELEAAPRDTERAAAPPEVESSGAPAPPWHTRRAGSILSARLVIPEQLCPRLDLGPGRPSALIGGPGAGKSDLAQALALAVATGAKAFGAFDVRRGRVLHLTYDMGFHACALRYRRLANGMGLRELDDSALEIDVQPAVTLRSNSALSAMRARFAGFALIILDNLRDATPGADENASDFGSYVTLFGRACADAGATGLYVHHSGKSEKGGARGTSAILGASGTVWEVKPKGDLGARYVEQVRMSDVADGPREPFWLGRQELPAAPAFAFDTGGRPSWRYVATDDEPELVAPPDARRDAIAAKVAASPGLSQSELYEACGGKRADFMQHLATLESEGLIECRTIETDGPKPRKCYFPKTGNH